MKLLRGELKMKCEQCNLDNAKIDSNLCEHCEIEFREIHLKRLDALKILLEALEEYEPDKKDKIH